MFLLASLAFKVIPLDIPHGVAVEEQAQVTHARYPGILAPPVNVRMNKQGIVAVVVMSTTSKASSTISVVPQKILIFNHANALKVLSPPSDSVLGSLPVFAAAEEKPDGQKMYPKAAISSIYVSEENKVYANIQNPFDGAYSGIARWTLVHRKNQWINAISDWVSRECNATITAIENSKYFAYVDDYESAPTYTLDDAQEGRIDQDELYLHSDRTLKNEGHGTISDIDHSIFVGYDFHYYPASIGKTLPSTAFMWSHGTHRNLGRGIAWSVNALGFAVGDDRSSINQAGHPTIWIHGKTHKISNSVGSAFGINHTGVIVGDLLSKGAFLAVIHGEYVSVTQIDRLLGAQAKRWHVEHAYAIAEDDSILAMAVDRSGTESLVLLTPI